MGASGVLLRCFNGKVREPPVADVDRRPIQGGAALLEAEVYIESQWKAQPAIDNNVCLHVHRITVPIDPWLKQSCEAPFDY
jgi:hypothetical protein